MTTPVAVEDSRTYCPGTSASDISKEAAYATLAAILATRKQVRYSSSAQKIAKTYNSGYSLVVTHLTTNPPVRCLNRAERTGSLVVSWPLTTDILNSTVSGSAGPGITQQRLIN